MTATMVSTQPGPDGASHELKVPPGWFEDVRRGEVSAVLAEAGAFRVGDHLNIREWQGILCGGRGYTGRALLATVTHVADKEPGLVPGFTLVSFRSQPDPNGSGGTVELAFAVGKLHERCTRAIDRLAEIPDLRAVAQHADKSNEAHVPRAQLERRQAWAREWIRGLARERDALGWKYGLTPPASHDEAREAIARALKASLEVGVPQTTQAIQLLGEDEAARVFLDTLQNPNGMSETMFVLVLSAYWLAVGVYAGRRLRDHELHREAQRRSQRCQEEVAPMAERWLLTCYPKWVSVGETSLEIRKYVRHSDDDIVAAVAHTFDALVKKGEADRRFQPGVICGGYSVYQAQKTRRERQEGGTHG